MKVTPKEARRRLQLLYFIAGLAYLYDKKLDNMHIDSNVLSGNDKQSIEDVLTFGTTAQLNKLLPSIAFYYDISVNALRSVLKGYEKPKIELLSVINKLVDNRKNLGRYIRAITLIYHLDTSKLLSQKLSADRLKNIIVNDTETKEVTLDRYAKVFKAPERIFVNAFQRAGIKVECRMALRNYIRAILFVKKLNMPWLAKRLSLSYNTLNHAFISTSASNLHYIIHRLPVTLSIPKEQIKDILSGSRQPQLDFMRYINPKVKGRAGLRDYVTVFAYLNDETLPSLSRLTGHNSAYAYSVIQHDSGESISKLLCEIADVMYVPNAILLSALARANVPSASHSYKIRMYFVVDYDKSPIKFTQSPDHQKRDALRVQKRWSHAKLVIKDSKKGKGQKSLSKDLKKIILNWSFMYGFNGKDFIKNNFRHFGNPNYTTEIVQEQKSTPVKKNHDWLEIFKKIHQQLVETQHAVSLPELQKTPSARYIYVNGVNLARPLASTSNIGLAPLVSDKTRYTFQGRFRDTGIKVMPNATKDGHDYYRPLIVVDDILCNRKPVAKRIELNYVSGLTKLGKLQEGDIITFDARVQKQHVGQNSVNSVQMITYGMVYPNNIKIKRRFHARHMVNVPTDLATLTGFAIENSRMTGYDFTHGGNYGYARYCINKYKNWKKQQELLND